jgi:hypothetical protein
VLPHSHGGNTGSNPVGDATPIFLAFSSMASGKVCKLFWKGLQIDAPDLFYPRPLGKAWVTVAMADLAIFTRLAARV